MEEELFYCRHGVDGPYLVKRSRMRPYKNDTSRVVTSATTV
jgi:hypothetical protein